MNDKKGIAAAIGAVITAYLQEEEAATDAGFAIQGDEPAAAARDIKSPPAGASPWRLFGRQELMRTRGLWRRGPRVK